MIFCCQQVQVLHFNSLLEGGDKLELVFFIYIIRFELVLMRFALPSWHLLFQSQQ